MVVEWVASRRQWVWESDSSKGYRLVDDSNGRLRFRGTDGSFVRVDKDSAEISLYFTGTVEEQWNSLQCAGPWKSNIHRVVAVAEKAEETR